jgi:PAS domain S-box-containing protein
MFPFDTLKAGLAVANSSQAQASGVSEAEVDQHKTRLFYRNAVGAQVVFIIVASLLLVYTHHLGLTFWALLWWLLATAVAGARMLLARAYLARQQSLASIPVWRHRGMLGAAVAGVVWAAGGVGFMLHDPAGARLFFALMMTGMISGAVATLAAIPNAFRLFALPIAASIVATSLLDAHGTHDYLLAFAVAVYLPVLLRSARNLHDSLDETIRSALRMRLLAEELTATSTALRASEARLSMLLEHDPSAIFLVAPDGAIAYVNPQAERLVGYQRDTLLGMAMRDILPDETRMRAGAVPVVQAHGQGDRRVIVEARSVDLPDGACLKALDDITERMRIEAELDQHRHHLEDLVAKRTADLLEATARAERLARVKGEFLANMSHELRTPLNGVLGFAEIGLRGRDIPEKARAYFGHIVASGNQLLEIINDILDYSKIDSGRLKTEMTPYVIQDVLKACLASVEPAARAKGLALDLDLDPLLPETTVGDPYRVRQVLDHLLDNAVKFSHAGGVRLEARRDGEFLVYRVRDSGIGMTPEQMAELFQPFSQVDGSSTRRYGGTGIGLVLGKRLAELMRGEIGVQSLPGSGSIFELRLPYVATEAGAPLAATPPAGAAVARLAGLRVLVAEDNEENRQLLDEMLRAEGCAPVLAEDGARAVALARERGAGAFQAVLMDVSMPVMNGLEATRRILEIDPDLPVIGQSAHVLDEERAECLAAGMREMLAKPIDFETLVRTLLARARHDEPGFFAAKERRAG